jgi:two-component system chemotaxis response regulator CheB
VVQRDVVVVGASAGGVEALRTLVSGLPVDFPAAVLVVLHTPASSRSALASILTRSGPLPAVQAEEDDELQAGRILVAPPDRHLIVYGQRVTLSRGPHENGHRPAVDVLFRSAARAWGERLVGVVLSGTLDDGAAGTVAVAQRGGRCVVQSDALFDGMPRAAMSADAPQQAPAREIGAVLESWLAELQHAEPQPPTALMEEEVALATMDPDALHDHDRPGEPAGFGCPDCAGALYRITEGKLTRFRCRVGHAWSPDGLLARQSVALESALWMALRSLEEKAALQAELRSRAETEGRDRSAVRFAAGAEEALRAAELVRQLVIELGEVQDHGGAALSSHVDERGEAG